MSDSALRSAPYAAYTTNELREWLRRPHSGMTAEVTERVYREVERREKVANGDVSVMTPAERREPKIEVTFDEQAAFWTFGKEAWHATFGDYDLGCTVGTGKTPLDAIVDLLDQTE